MDQNRENPKKNTPGDGKKPKLNIWVMLLIAVAIVLVISTVYNAIANSQFKETTYDEFLNYMKNGQLHEVELQSDRIVYLTKEEAEKPAEEQQAYFTGLPVGDVMGLAERLHLQGVQVKQNIEEDNSLIMMILYYGLMIGILVLMMRSITKRFSGDGVMGGFGQSKAKMYMEKQTGVTFKDVAGEDEAKESLVEVVD